MFQLLHPLVKAIQPFLVPVCFVLAWLLIGGAIWSLMSAFRDSVKTAQRLHQIPCADCQFFTRDYHLKCAVHPSRALSEQAIDCPDYRAHP
ncbi:MAG: hypothetical protein KME16_23980 [Scytolyngbya sp. HA4215-MV1]|nr:hypothetical protein [Scytolyngbya sp. HA4215-MV1]